MRNQKKKIKNNKNILFVCTGNTCRSPLAEGLLRSLLDENSELMVHSAGIFASSGSPASSEVISLLKEKGVDFSHFRSSLVSGSLLQEASHIFCFTPDHLSFLETYYPAFQEKYHLIAEASGGIVDPYGGRRIDYQRVLKILEESFPHLLRLIDEENLSSKL